MIMAVQQIEHEKYIPRRLKNRDGFIDPSLSMIYMIQGDRGEGKSSLDEKIAEENYSSGHTILDIHSASNYESLYWAVNHGCKEYWDNWRKKQELLPLDKRKKELPHCDCDTRYKILLVVPDYVEMDQEAIDIFNGKYISREKYLENGGDPTKFRIQKRHESVDSKGDPVVSISTERRVDPDYVEYLKVRKLHVPNKGFKNREIFVEELTYAMLTAQKDRRIFVINPKFYKDVQHKLKTLEMIVREIPDIVSSHFKPLTSQDVMEMRGTTKYVPYNKFTKFERNYHRVTVLMREFGSLVSQQLNEERNQVIVKKAIFGIIKVIRQFRMSGIFDFQRYADIYSGVRDQRDIFLWRKSNIDIFPKDYEWLKKLIAEDRIEEAKNIGFEYAQKLYPNFEDLKKDQMYVLYKNKNSKGRRYKLFKVAMPKFHHRQEDDDFEQDWGIKKETVISKGTWRFVIKNKDGDTIDSVKDEQREDKKVQDANMQKLYELATSMLVPVSGKKKMTYDEVYEHLNGLKMIPVGWAGSGNLRTMISRTKKRLAKIQN